MATLKDRVVAICQASDLSSLTERQIRAELSKELGAEEVKAQSQQIRSYVEEYIAAEAARAGATDADYKAEDDEEESEEEQPKPRKKQKTEAGSSKSKPSGGKAAGRTGGEIDLGSKKRVTVSNFRGSSFVDMREWYLKDGELAPGKKGISLKPAEWRALVDARDSITAALADKDLSFCLQLAPKRKVTLSNFKGTLYVGVREFYEKDGQELPGSKGLSMNEAQWKALAAGAEEFTAAMP